MTEHADLELIATFHEGLLDPAATGRVGRHLAECAACAQRAATLTEVTTLLSGSAVPPVPAHVAQRLDAVLAAEIAAARAAAGAAALAGTSAAVSATQTAAESTFAGQPRTAAGDEGTGERGTPPTYRRRGRTRGRAGHERAARGWMTTLARPLAAAAAVCLLAGGGYLLLRTSTSTPTATSAGASAPRKQPPPAGSALTPRQPQAAREAPGGTGASGAEGPAAAVLVVYSRTDYQAARLRTQAAAVLRVYQAAIPAAGQAGIGTAQPFGSPALSACLREVAAGRPRLLVDMATYQGHPATVIIAPGTGGRSGHVWVVSPGCSAPAHHVVADAGL